MKEPSLPLGGELSLSNKIRMLSKATRWTCKNLLVAIQESIKIGPRQKKITVYKNICSIVNSVSQDKEMLEDDAR